MRKKNNVHKLFFTLIKIILFFLITIYIAEILFNKFVIWPFIYGLETKFLGYKNQIQFFTHLDYGRFVGRISSFIAVFIIFLLFLKFIDKERISNSVLFPHSSKSKYFFYGFVFGFILVSITIFLSLIFKFVVIYPIHNWMRSLLPIILLYLIAQLLTATTEELILRGYILKNLVDVINPTLAVIISSCFFGIIHLSAGLLYAALAILFGLILGFGFIFTRNLYFCIGIHFGWNFVESVFYSNALVKVDVKNALWVGAKNITPDREGLICLPVLLLGLIFILRRGPKV